MTLTIKTTATGGEVRVFVIDQNKQTLLKVKENETKSVDLTAGDEYAIEWHVSGEGAAKYTIDGEVKPASAHDPDFHIEKSFTAPHVDQGAFKITV